MAPAKRRKMSSDDAEQQNTNETAESGVLATREGKSHEQEGDHEQPCLPNSVPNSGTGPNDNLSETQGSIVDATPDKDSQKRQKNKGSGEDDSMKPTRISERLIIKRNRLGDAEDDCAGSSQTQTPPRKGKTSSDTATKQQQKKPVTKTKKLTRKPGAQWTPRDKKLFFIYLGEYGKDFEAISKRLSYRAKMHGQPQKDKMQVRYFYYRCWAKISKLIHLSDETTGVKPVTQELYGLINYGVLRKYVKETDSEFGNFLNELILQGETSYMVKAGKSKRPVKLKTPKCTYLKKINRIEDKRLSEASASSKLPAQVTLELTPKNSSAWAKVQEISQNPRIRFKLSTNRTLESVFRYLGTKWKSNRIRLKETLGGLEEEPSDEIACFLHPSCQITPLTFIPQDPQKIDVAFNSYRENILPFLVKRKRPKVSKEQEKTGGDGASSAICVSQSEQDNKSKISNEEAADSVNKTAPPDGENNVKNGTSTEAMDCEPSEEKRKENIALSQPKSPLAEIASIASSVPNLPEDENAVFMDLSKFSQPKTPDNNQKSPSSPSTPASSKSGLPAKNQSMLDVVVSSPLPNLSVPPCLSSPSSSITSVILSPSLQKKKQTKSACKRTLSVDSNPSIPQDPCDNMSVPDVKDSFPKKTENSVSTAAKNMREESEREFERLSGLSVSGFTLANSNNVTLLHLSLMLGRATVIRLEYEWREKVKPKSEILPAFCKATSQMANVLRRLCNIAQLELTSFQQDGKSQSGRSKKRDGVRDVSTMTDPIKHTILPHPNASVMAGHSRTFIAANPPQAIQLNGRDPVFRVPLVPAFHPPVLSKEEQEKLKFQEQQAKAIMQMPSKSRLLKKRNLPSRSRKQPPIVVQRTLLPKVSSPMITYIPGPGVQSQTIVKVKQEEGILGHPTAADVSDALKEAAKIEPVACNGSNILSLAAQVAQIDELSAMCQDSLQESSQKKFIPVSAQSASLSSVSVSTQAPVSRLLSSTSPIKGLSTITSQSDISLSDFDISLASANASNMGPDAGDKFLDSVLQNSQGFSGLIDSTKKSQGLVSNGSAQLQSISVDTDLGVFESSVLHTPPHSSSSYNPSTSSLEFPSPMNLNMTEQPWLSTDSGDISLSSILGESSSFHGSKPKLKTPTKSSDMTTLSHSVFFDNSSSDAVDNPPISLSKPSLVSDVSLSCLLNDSNLCTPKVEPLSLNTNPADTLPIIKTSPPDNIFSSGISSEGPPSTLFSEASQDSFAKLDVDVTFQGMVSESSMDFVTKFENLAAHISGHQDHDSSSKLNTPIKKEPDVDENEPSRKVDGFVSLSLKNM